MSEQCYREHEFAELADLPAGDPRLAHLEQCARCRAQRILFREFMDPTLPEHARTADASAHLSAIVRKATRERSAGAGFAALLRGFLFHPVVRPAILVAATAVLILIIRDVWPPGGGTREPTVLRGAGHASIVAAEPELLADGRLRLSWQSTIEEVQYQAIFLDAAQRELLRVDAGGEMRVSLEPEATRLLSGERAGVLWRIVALRHGDEIARSSLRTLQLNP